MCGTVLPMYNCIALPQNLVLLMPPLSHKTRKIPVIIKAIDHIINQSHVFRFFFTRAKIGGTGTQFILVGEGGGRGQ